MHNTGSLLRTTPRVGKENLAVMPEFMLVYIPKCSSELFRCVIWTTILKASIKYSMVLENKANSVYQDSKSKLCIQATHLGSNPSTYGEFVNLEIYQSSSWACWANFCKTSHSHSQMIISMLGWDKGSLCKLAKRSYMWSSIQIFVLVQEKDGGKKI